MTATVQARLVGKKLAQLVIAMQQADMWQQQPPPPEALQSRLPFSCDRLSFASWLQFIFIVNIEHLLSHHQPLPQQCGLQPMAQQSWTLQGPVVEVYQLLGEIDRLLSKESV